MGKYAANNHSYVFIPADKLVELVKTACPPRARNMLRDCLTDTECANCWYEWLKEGNSNG